MLDTVTNPIRKSLPRHLVEFLGDRDSIETYIAEYEKKPIVNDIIKINTQNVMNVIKPFYDSKDIEINIGQVAWIIGEPLKNANFYSGNDDKPITFGAYMSENGLVTSYNDGGEYFRNQNVKRYWENKEHYHEKFNGKIHGVGKGLGTRIIYHNADIIYVDASEGTLYIGLGINKILLK